MNILMGYEKSRNNFFWLRSVQDNGLNQAPFPNVLNKDKRNSLRGKKCCYQLEAKNKDVHHRRSTQTNYTSCVFGNMTGSLGKKRGNKGLT